MQVMTALRLTNQLVQEQKPWRLKGEDDAEKLECVLSITFESLSFMFRPSFNMKILLVLTLKIWLQGSLKIQIQNHTHSYMFLLILWLKIRVRENLMVHLSKHIKIVLLICCLKYRL